MGLDELLWSPMNYRWPKFINLFLILIMRPPRCLSLLLRFRGDAPIPKSHKRPTFACPNRDVESFGRALTSGPGRHPYTIRTCEIFAMAFNHRGGGHQDVYVSQRYVWSFFSFISCAHSPATTRLNAPRFYLYFWGAGHRVKIVSVELFGPKEPGDREQPPRETPPGPPPRETPPQKHVKSKQSKTK